MKQLISVMLVCSLVSCAKSSANRTATLQYQTPHTGEWIDVATFHGYETNFTYCDRAAVHLSELFGEQHRCIWGNGDEDDQ